jgi:monothiol glutaredoxin
MSERNIQQEIGIIVSSNPVVIFMKGSLSFPMCGFSQRAAAILQSYNIKVHAVNVLDDQAIREGVKQYSDWPTIPQVYVNGTFIGGSDSLIELHESGELAKLLSIS